MPLILLLSSIWLAFGGKNVTLAHLEKKRTRLRLYTKSLEEIIIQAVETTSPAIATASELDQDRVRIFQTASGSSHLKRNPRSFIEATASGILRRSNEGFDKIKLKYMGGYWVMIEFQTEASKEKFRANVGIELFFVYKDLIFESQDMSTSTTHQQSLADVGSETRPPMLERGEALVSVYNRFAQLMNNLERNGIKFPKVTVNTKFLNCLQPEWLKYVTQVHLAKRLTKDSYNDLFDYLSQYEKLFNASIAKKLENSHDPFALVVHTGSSSIIPSPYYVTHPFSVVDYDDDYQGDAFQNNYEDSLISVMMLLARAITQRFSNLTNNRLRTSSNTRNQAIVQADKNDVGNIQRNLRTMSLGSAVNVHCYNCSEKDEKNDFLVADATRMEEIEELSANICLMAIIQLANINSDAGPSYDYAFLNVNSGSVEYNNNVQASYELEQLARNAYKEAEKQQNKVLTQQLELYKEKVWVFEMTTGDNTTFLNKFIEADSKARHLEMDLQTQFIRDRDMIRDLEQKRDNLQLFVVKLKIQIVELQKTQTILKRKMSENEYKYHDIVLDLEARAKENENVVLKIGRSLQGMFMLGPKPMSFYDSNVKHGLGYVNPYTLKKAISQNPKLYDAPCFDDTKIHVNIRGTEDILDDATKSQKKMDNKFIDPIAIEKKQNVRTIDYNKLNALYEDFVTQKELSAEQKYFSSTFIPSENSSNANTSTSPSETKPPVASMPSSNPMKLYLEKMENEFKKLFAVLQKILNVKAFSIQLQKKYG
ncbi:hypothetical protein Tco_0977923 [Tanacetum coccineum]|uniref:Uncharacterized protein n=1 Tax=Tanacetum coccineum TaxID=301880 RepID=A0ABQ5ELI3_9ASTR